MMIKRISLFFGNIIIITFLTMCFNQRSANSNEEKIQDNNSVVLPINDNDVINNDDEILSDEIIDDDDEILPDDDTSLNIYISGYEGTDTGQIACYWLNRQKFYLTAGKTTSVANDITILNNDIYIVGMVDFAACYWKNGEITYLTDGKRSDANNIYIYGSDIYISGCERNASGAEIACYWKNGQKVNLTDGAISTVAKSIVVSKNNIYVVIEEGEYIEGGEGLKLASWYWINGKKNSLTVGKNYNFNDIAVYGDDIYLSGYEKNGLYNNSAYYWKNGQKVKLENVDKSNIASSIFVSGSDIYILGNTTYREQKMVWYWKNGDAVFLKKGNKIAEADDIIVFGDDVYVAGTAENAAGYRVACYWKNKKICRLNENKTSNATSIIIVP